MGNTSLSAFFRRIRADDHDCQWLVKEMLLSIHLVRAFDTTQEGLLTGNDAGGEWFDADSVTPPNEPLRAIVIRQSDGTATDSPYSLLQQIIGHCRKVVNGLCTPDWDGLLCHAYITPEYAEEWECAAVNKANPFDSKGDGCSIEEAILRAGVDMSKEEINAACAELMSNGNLIEWGYWVSKMPILTAAQAARLMSGLDPDLFENLDSRPNHYDPSSSCARAKRMQRLAEAQQKSSLNPQGWLNWADENQFWVHEAFRIACKTFCAAQQSDNFLTSSERSSVGITVHLAKRRGNILDAVIARAKSTSIDPTDPHSIWAELARIAGETDRPAPLLGYVDGEGVKYQGADGETLFFTAKNLRDRIARERAKTR